MTKFIIGTSTEDEQEFAANIAFLEKEWPWPSTKKEIVMKLVREEADKIRKIQKVVADHAAKKRKRGQRSKAPAPECLR